MNKYSRYLALLSRPMKVGVQLVVDATLIVLAFIGAMLFRLESFSFLGDFPIWAALFAATGAGLLALCFLGVYHILVRFLTGSVLISISVAALIMAITLHVSGIIFDARIPRSVPVIFGIFSFLAVGGVRFAARGFFRNPNQVIKRPVIIYGAGESGRQVLNALFHGREYAPAALVDDDPDLHNLSVGGLRVHAPDRIPKLLQVTGAQIVLLAIPTLGRARRREIINHLENLKVEIKTVPNLSDIVSGRARISELRVVTPEDLLGRDPIMPDPELLGKNISGRVVMVSGAGGSIGSELCRQVLSQGPRALVLFDVSEFALYTIQAELSAIAIGLQSATRIEVILGSVQNSAALENAISEFGVQTIYHAAAYKHVPLLEDNVVEAVQNNVFGTLAITLAAKKLGVENFILISTDKAVRPTNVMGATKRIAELICQAHAQESSGTVFTMVRFGNVLGSSGSVIPRFSAQIESGGPVTVTHKDITRYFMTIPEAAQLVIQAGAMAKGGDVFVLDMGDPVKIMDLAIGMVKLHGLVPCVVDHPDQTLPKEGDIPIYITGLRKGEKLYEELLIGSNSSPTPHPRIMTACEVFLPMASLTTLLDHLRQACEDVDLASITSIFQEFPLGYAPIDGKISHRVAQRSKDREGL